MTETVANTFCGLSNFLNNFSTISVYCAISIISYDRYKYLYLKSSYNTKVNIQTAVDEIISSKIIIFILTGFGIALDPEARKCQHNLQSECNILIRNDIFWFGLPCIFSFCFVSNLLIYAIKEKIKQNREQYEAESRNIIENQESKMEEQIISISKNISFRF